MDQMKFKLNITSNICKLAKPVARKRGRSSVNTVQNKFEKKKQRGPAKPILAFEIRRDQTSHMLLVTEKKQRCKLTNYKNQAVFKCLKCEAHQRLNKNPNFISKKNYDLPLDLLQYWRIIVSSY